MATSVRIDENGNFRIYVDGAAIVIDKETAEELFWDLEDALSQYNRIANAFEDEGDNYDAE